MGVMVSFPSNGKTAQGYLAVPESGAGPGVIVIQEWWGLVDHIKDVADRFAAAGFVALAPDLYDGDTADSFDRTLEFALRHKLCLANFNPLTPTPGAPLYARLEREHGEPFDLGRLRPEPGEPEPGCSDGNDRHQPEDTPPLPERPPRPREFRGRTDDRTASLRGGRGRPCHLRVVKVRE